MRTRKPTGPAIGARVRRRRLARRISQTDLADLAGISRQELCRFELGRYPRGPQIATLQRIALAVGCDLASLLGAP